MNSNLFKKYVYFLPSDSNITGTCLQRLDQPEEGHSEGCVGSMATKTEKVEQGCSLKEGNPTTKQTKLDKTRKMNVENGEFYTI